MPPALLHSPIRWTPSRSRANASVHSSIQPERDCDRRSSVQTPAEKAIMTVGKLTLVNRLVDLRDTLSAMIQSTLPRSTVHFGTTPADRYLWPDLGNVASPTAVSCLD